jgi:hypothetical protein
MNRNEITPAMLEALTPAVLAAMSPEDLEVHILATYQPLVTPAVALRVRYTDVARRAAMQYRHGAEMVTIDTRYSDYVDVSLDVLKSVECAWFDMWPVDVDVNIDAVVDINRTGFRWASNPPTPTPKQPTPPATTMYATLVAGVANRYAPEVLMSTSYATMQDWVAGEKLCNHPGTTWVVRTVALSVEVGTHVVYVDGGDVLTKHSSMVDVAEMMRYYAGGMAGDLGATLDTCHTAYDVVATVCNHLVGTGCSPFDIDGEMLGVVMYTGDYHTPLTNNDLEAYANMWYTSLETIDTCRGCGYTVDVADAVLIDDEVWCEMCYADTVATCRGCGCEMEEDYAHHHNGEVWCEMCYNNQPVHCDGCGCDDVMHCDNGSWCEMCYVDTVCNGDDTGDLHDVVATICDEIMAGVYATTPYGTVGTARVATPNHYNEVTPSVIHEVTFNRYNTPAERDVVIIAVRNWQVSKWVEDETTA